MQRWGPSLRAVLLLLVQAEARSGGWEIRCLLNPSRKASMLWMWQAWSPSSSITLAPGMRSPSSSTTRLSQSAVLEPLASRTGQRMFASSSIDRPDRSDSSDCHERAIRCRIQQLALALTRVLLSMVFIPNKIILSTYGASRSAIQKQGCILCS